MARLSEKCLNITNITLIHMINIKIYDLKNLCGCQECILTFSKMHTGYRWKYVSEKGMTEWMQYYYMHQCYNSSFIHGLTRLLNLVLQHNNTSIHNYKKTRINGLPKISSELWWLATIMHACSFARCSCPRSSHFNPIRLEMWRHSAEAKLLKQKHGVRN